MKKRRNKKLALNKQKISELSEVTLKGAKGGCSFDVRCTGTDTFGMCTGTATRFICPPVTFDYRGCGTFFEEK